MPSLSSPIELSMPPVVSTVRGGGLPSARLLRDRLGQDSAQPRQVDQAGHFAGVAERARGHGDRIGQVQAAQLNVEMNAGGIHGLSIGRRRLPKVAIRSDVHCGGLTTIAQPMGQNR